MSDPSRQTEAAQPDRLAATATPQARFHHARFYITFRCNARCGYCNVWQDQKFAGYHELPVERIRKSLDELHGLGVRYVDFTGGEPVLNRNLGDAVRHAKSLGMAVEVTTNAMRFAGQIDDIVPFVDTMNISLDTLDPARYQAIRGVGTLHRTIDLVRVLRERSFENLKLITVVTRRNLDELDRLVAFAQEQRVVLYPSPMFEYFDGQDVVRDPSRTMRALRLQSEAGPPHPVERPLPARRLPPGEILERLAELLYEPMTVVGMHFLRHVRVHDPAAATDCAANKHILTVGPDGRILLPCYHQFDGSLSWDRPYAELVEDPEFRRVRDEEVGTRPGCRGCTVFPYLGLSMSFHLTTQFLVQALSEEISKLKLGFVDPRHPAVRPDQVRLLERYREVEAMVETRLGHLRPGTPDSLLYHIERDERGLRTDFARDPVSLAEVLADHLQADCWKVQRSPHRGARLLYHNILPALRDAFEAGSLSQAIYDPLLCRVYDAQLDWWMAFAGRYLLRPDEDANPGSGAEALSPEHATRKVLAWLAAAASALPLSPARDAGRAHQAMRVLAAVLGAAPDAVGPPISLAGHPEERLAAKFLLLGAPPARQRQWAPAFSPALAAALRGDRPVPPAERAEADAERRRSLAAAVASRDGITQYLGQLLTDDAQLGWVLDNEPLLDASVVRRLAAGLRLTVTDAAYGAELEQRLLDLEIQRLVVGQRPAGAKEA
jgi:MoaA/NifB/PqqE/SkfB family radical SAM enzyme